MPPYLPKIEFKKYLTCLKSYRPQIWKDFDVQYVWTIILISQYNRMIFKWFKLKIRCFTIYILNFLLNAFLFKLYVLLFVIFSLCFLVHFLIDTFLFMLHALYIFILYIKISQSCTLKFLSQNESGIKHIFFTPKMESTKV